MRTLLLPIGAVGALPLLAALGCKPVALESDGLACSAGECLDGYVCHPETNICVPEVAVGCNEEGSVCPSTTSTGDPCTGAGSFIPCADGATDCSAGCRTCEGGTWSTCSGTSCTVGLPASCSACDDDCTATVLNATATCDTSGATNVCSYTACDTDWLDVDGDQTNGCECIPQNGGVEIACNDIDEDCVGGDLLETGTLHHCADCADDCSTTVRNATPSCATYGKPSCSYTACTAPFKDADGDRTNGCECETTHSGVETCDALDNDCNGTDDDVTDLAADCNTILNDPPDVVAYSCEALQCAGSHCCVITECTPGTVDADNDPATGCEAQCVPTTPTDEICDGLDNDCDGRVDNPSATGANGCTDYFRDEDHDTFGVDNDTECWCRPTGTYTAARGGDCDDRDGETYDGAPERVADGIDQSCDGFDACYEDRDGDGFGTTTVVIDNDTNCRNGSAATAVVDTDCDDSSSLCTETCDDFDADRVWDCKDDCIDSDGDGYGYSHGGTSGTCLGVDCDATSRLCNTACDDLDDDQVWDCKDDCVDVDGDGYGSGNGCIDSDCDDTRAACTTDCNACKVCTPSQPYCASDGRTLEVCLDSGTGPNVAARTVCDYLCDSGSCFAASNVTGAVMGSCDNAAPVLAPAAPGTITITTFGITCSADCGSGSNRIYGSGGTGSTDPLIVCVASADIPSGVTVVASPSVTAPFILLSDGDVTVAGDIVLDGSVAAGGSGLGRLGGGPGPGAGSGGDGCNAQDCTGNPGDGRNPDAPPAPASGGGEGGARRGGNEAGGGGGGGFAGTGGRGGNGPNDTDAGAGGGTYGSTNLEPLLAGSGGGSGGDGQSCLDSGPGGGGGGAIQITSRGAVTVTGTIGCSGGNGGDSRDNCSAGGGGSGGAILLEARSVSCSGALAVNGGKGGSVANGGAGGAGAAATSLSGADGSLDASAAGGGGGGGGGRIRINSRDASPCVNVSPIGACTAGGL